MNSGGEISGNVNNLYLNSGAAAEIAGLETGARIGVTTDPAPEMGKPIPITGGTGSNDYSGYFFSDSGDGR